MESPFRGPLPDRLMLIETFGRRDGGFVRLAEHLARLERTARALGLAFERAAIDRVLAGVAGDGPLRVRLTLDRQGVPAVQAVPLAPGPAVWTLAIHEDRLDSSDPWLRVKTSARARYDRARAALPAGVDEWLFLNTRGEVCEGTITNLFLRRDGRLLTPPIGSGLLPGVLRGRLLMEGAREVVLTPEDLARGELLVGNSLRGLAPARLQG
jgi:4-amino-4-deoxychorismate lyase